MCIEQQHEYLEYAAIYHLQVEKYQIECGWYDSEDESDFGYHGQSVEVGRRYRIEAVNKQIAALN